ncbi:cell wall hydrolase (plasmid) [Paracoccus liaowanqingii]|uniref:Cell wall hydrolase n=1 Tax=Paracoccus liaowanqingii TaxID=2560053 RepID=A0A4Y5SSU8_9RHOB|nr:cell wall hydrolase [Paracoccus liaowanqingii]QDA35958.1 cell wall hydrolase [Paracoccus liaowanqingii]
MIRAFLAMAFTVVAAWQSSGLVFTQADERVTGGQAQLGTNSDARGTAPAEPLALAATPYDPWAPLVVQPAPLAQDTPGAPSPQDPALVLRGSQMPLPRPTGVVTTRPHPRPPSAAQILDGARIPAPPASLQNASDLTCIAVAIYHEARDQTDLGQRAVASVILQRAAVPHRWGRTACDSVVPVQFSFMTSRYDYPPIKDMESWKKAVQFAAEAFLQGPMRELRGADHYHTTAVSPDWAPRMIRVRVIDDHVFYADPRSRLSL